jgi:uncharacterized protein (TIGR03435 family)
MPEAQKVNVPGEESLPDAPSGDLVRESLRKLGLMLVREKIAGEMLIVDHIGKPSAN